MPCQPPRDAAKRTPEQSPLLPARASAPACRGERGYALILLQPHELPYADLLRAAGLTLSQRSSADTLCRLVGAALPRQALGLSAAATQAAPAAAALASAPGSAAAAADHPDDDDDDDDGILGVTVPDAALLASAAATASGERRVDAAARLGLDADDPALAGVDLSRFSAFGPPEAAGASAAVAAGPGEPARSGGGSKGHTRVGDVGRILGLVDAAAAAAARVKHRGGLPRGGSCGEADSAESRAATRSAEMQVGDSCRRAGVQCIDMSA